jgi:bifunctional DNase/RNase
MVSMLVQTEIWTMAKNEQGNAVLLRPLKTPVIVPIFIGQLEAQSILVGLGDIPMPRPNSHDLILRLLKTCRLHLVKIEITAITEDVFIANLVIKRPVLALPGGTVGQEEFFNADARPSDALALAVRAKCPIFMDQKVIDEAGVPLDNFLGQKDELAQVDRIKIKGLKDDLARAVREENYDEAARLRDLLPVLGKGNL